ncbi:MAG: glycosyltransferase family 39 protein, partial [Thermoanaerobaculia bacterium]
MTDLLAALALLAGFALCVLGLALTAAVLGRRVFGMVEDGIERWAVSTSFGLALLSCLGFFLGLAGWLRPGPVLLAAVGIHLLGLPAWRELARDFGRVRRNPRVLVLAAAVLAPSALLALYPPTAFDATLYHLPYVKAFVKSGGVPFLADLRFPVFPQANEILFAGVMLFGPDVAAHGVQWLATVLTAALLWIWGRDAFGAPAGGLAAAVYLGNPIVASLSGTAYVDPGLTLFVTAALFSLDRWRGSGERRWLALAALFAASAAAVKYLGLFFLALAGGAALLGGMPARPWPVRWRDTALFVGIAALAVVPWYGRIAFHTGNPVFPFFPEVFGSSPWDPLRFHSFLSTGEGGAGARAVLLRLAALVRLPWDLVFERQRYNWHPPLSPIYLAMLPLALAAAVRDGRGRLLLAVAAVYSLVCFSLPPDARYFLPVLPLVSLAVAGGLRPFVNRRLWIAGLCAGCLLPGWLYALHRIERQGPVPLTPEAREAYLLEKLPVYPALSWLNRTRGSDYTVWALDAERMAWFARGRFLGDWIGPASYG